MPIQEENDSFGIGSDQKPYFNTENLMDIEQGNSVTAKNVTTNAYVAMNSADSLHNTQQGVEGKIDKIVESMTKVTDSMAKVTENILHKLEQEDDARISKMAESMARRTENILHKLEQEDDARISKMAESMARRTEMTIGTFEEARDEPYILALKQTRLIEQLKQPCFQ